MRPSAPDQRNERRNAVPASGGVPALHKEDPIEGLPTFEAFLASDAGQALCAEVRKSAARYGAGRDDVLQDTLVRAWQQWHRFNDVTHLRLFCLRVARGLVIDHHRKYGAARIDLRSDVTGSFEVIDPEEALLELEERRARWHAFQGLPPEVQQLLLDEAEGASHRELAEQRRTTPGAIRTRLYRARLAIRDALRRHRLPTALPVPVAVVRWRLRRARAAAVRSTTITGRIMVGLSALTTISPLVVVPLTPALPQLTLVLPTVELPNHRIRLAANQAILMPAAPRPDAGYRPQAPAVRTRQRHEPDGTHCVVHVCLGPPADNPDDHRPGDAVCLTPANQCVAQELVAVCEYLAPVPPQAATCRRHGDPDWTVPPPPEQP